MSDAIDSALVGCSARGEVVALARIVDSGVGCARMLIWPGGQALGDLGSPRLNQRVALYAEGLIERGGEERKTFDVPDGEVEVETRVLRPDD